MLTETGGAVDVPASDGVWMSITDVAKKRGISKQAVSKQLQRYEGTQHQVSTRKSGRTKLVNIVEFDRARDALDDPSKLLDVEQPKKDAGDGGYKKHRTDREGYQAELARLELEERQGKLRHIDEIEDGLAKIGVELSQSFGMMITWADELSSAANKGGVDAVRAVLKKKARELAHKSADRLASVVETDEE